MKKTLSSLLIFLGISLFLVGLYKIWERTNPNRLSFELADFKQAENSETQSTQSYPASIKIPSLSIDLLIYPGEVKDGKWESTKKGISHLKTSPIPGDLGNSILYGHNYPNLLGKLMQIKPNSDIYIYFQDGSYKRFVVEYTQEVGPNQVAILDPSNDVRITLYTCTGFFDARRFAVTAFLSN